MIVDAVVILIAVTIACGLGSRASLVVLAQHLIIYAIVNFWWADSKFWNAKFFGDYHFYLALINSLFVVILWRVSKRSYAVIIGSGVLILVSVISFYNRLLYLDGMTSRHFYEFMRDAYPFMRLGAISLQLAGLFHDADRNGGSIRKLHHWVNSRIGSSNSDRLSFAKIYK